MAAEIEMLKKLLSQGQEELGELREEQRQILTADGGPNESLSIMYNSLRKKYAAVKGEAEAANSRYEEVVEHVGKDYQMKDQIAQYKLNYEKMLSERNAYKQQCTQAIRNWEQS